MSRVQYLFRSRNIIPDTIKYIVREDKRSVIYFMDNQKISTSIPMKEIMTMLPEKDFVSIQKGVIVAVKQIIDISNSGVYTMTDGKTIQGRKRYLSEHKNRRAALALHVADAEGNFYPPMGLLEKCSLLDDLPLPYCVIELVFDKAGKGIDFIFRYCNKAMSTLTSFSSEAMIGHSFYEIFSNGDKKWLITYADVALNGGQHVIRDIGPDPEKSMNVYCYQPTDGYCACVLVQE